MMKTKTFSEQEILDVVKKAYEQGNADFPIIKEKCALLVIDMQDEFVKPHLSPFWVPESTRQVPKIKNMIEVCRRLDIPVIYTAFARTHEYLDRPKTGKFMPIGLPDIEPGNTSFFTENGKIYDELKPLEHEIVIYKPSYGAFYDTPLETILKNLERDTVIISGTLTNFCCGTTARQAYERGFKVVFGSDINATELPEMHEAELKVLRRGFAKVLSSEEIIAVLEATASA